MEVLVILVGQKHRKEANEALIVGASLELRREPGNRFDTHALAVDVRISLAGAVSPKF